MQVYKMYQKVRDPKQKKLDLKHNFDMPKPRKFVIKRREATNFNEKFNARHNFAEVPSSYE